MNSSATGWMLNSRNKTAYLVPPLVVAIVAIVALAPIIVVGLPNGADLQNHLRFALPFYDAIRSGSVYPGWLAESNYGLGDPRFRFYPPGLYYTMVLARFLTGDWYVATITSLVFLSVVGGLGAYFWARSFLGTKMAICAGILYTVVPYRLNEVYQASLLSEYAACSILPFVFAFVERICRRKNAYDIAGLAASFALLLLTHLPMAVIGSISLFIYALLSIEISRLRATLVRLSLGVLLGMAASAFFWTTMLLELPLIKGNSAEPNSYYDYRVNFLFSPNALTNRNTWYANLLALALIGFLLPAIRWIFRLMRDDRCGLRAAAFVMLISFLMATPLSRPVWLLIPKLSEVQFPWRWLAITSVAGVLLVAASIPFWQEVFRSGLKPRALAIVLAFVLSLGFVLTQVVLEADYLTRGSFESMLQDSRQARSFKDWLPVQAKEYLEVQKMAENVEAASRKVNVVSWQSEHRIIHIEDGPADVVRVRTYFYPLWVATERVGGNVRSLPVSAAPDGVLLVTVPAGAADIDVAFREPPRVRYTAMVSAIAWFGIAGIFIIGGVRRSRDFVRRKTAGPGAVAGS